MGPLFFSMTCVCFVPELFNLSYCGSVILVELSVLFPAVFFLFRIVLASIGLLCFHINLNFVYLCEERSCNFY